MSSTSSSFHRLLTFFSARTNTPNKNTIRFTDSLKGDLSIGLNFPLAVILATLRHLVFGNTGFLSLDIYVPTVRTSRTLLGGPGKFRIEEEKQYGLTELVGQVRRDGAGLVATADAVGLWALAANRQGTVSGSDVRAFQRGDVMERIAERRKGRAEVLPFWRGGPIW